MADDRIEVDTGTSELLCEIRDRVALITLNRPEARNALSDRLTPALRRMIVERFRLMSPVVEWLNEQMLSAMVAAEAEAQRPRRPEPMF